MRTFGQVTGLTVQPLGLDTGKGINTNDATATAADMLKDKTAYAKGSKLIGSLIQGFVPVAGDTFQFLYLGGYQDSNLTWERKMRVKLYMDGTIRIKFRLRVNSTPTTAKTRVYINGVPVGTERSNNTTTPIEFSEDFTIKNGDTVEFWLLREGSFNVCIVDNLYITTANKLHDPVQNN